MCLAPAIARAMAPALDGALGPEASSLTWEGSSAAVPQWTPLSLSSVTGYYETDSQTYNSIVSTAYSAINDMSAAGKHLTSASAGVRPAVITSTLLPGWNIAQFDGTDDWLRNTNTSRPVSGAILCRYSTWQSGLPMWSFGSGNFPRLRKAGVNGRAEFDLTSTAIASQPATTLTDEYFRVIMWDDDGATQYCYVYDAALDESTVVSDSDANANTRATDGQTFSLGAFVTGTSPAQLEVAALLTRSVSTTAAERTQLLDYWRRNITERSVASRMDFVGTRVTRSDAAPRPYPSQHEGASGNAIADVQLRLAGAWGGSGGVTIGSGDDPGAGNRGAMETLATTRAITNMVAVVHVGTNDATSGAVNTTNYQRMAQRIWAVAGVGPGTLIKIILCTITGRTDGGGTPQTRIDTFNAALPGIITTLTGLGIPAVICDLAASFNTNTMLQGDGLHPNLLGAQTNAQTIYNVLSAQSLISSANKLVLIGDSITEGGTNLIPQATAQYRPWLARLLAA